MKNILKDLVEAARTLLPAEIVADFWPQSEIPESVAKPTTATSLKRSGWTNKEVIDLLENLMMPVDPAGLGDYYDGHNAALHHAIDEFNDFERPATESGAMAYNPQTGEIFHIGPPLPR